MFRALVGFVMALLAVGVWGLVSSGTAPAASPDAPTVTSFGFALAAGAIALAATLMMTRPRLRFRR